MTQGQLCITGLLAVSLLGCSTVEKLEEKKVDYRAAATQVPALEVPPDLTAPSADERFRVPVTSGDAATTYSDYAKTGAVVPPAAQQAATPAATPSSILADVKGVRLERNGTQRWLVIDDTPDNVWAMLQAFWRETGLPIKLEDKSAGVMETDWVENRAKIPQGGLRSILGKVFDNAYSSGERDLYRTRLERGKDGQTTEVYITHRGLQEMIVEGRTGSVWNARPNDPELEAMMLQRLISRFGGTPAPDLTAGTNLAKGKNKESSNVPEIKLEDAQLQPAVSSSDKKLVLNDGFDVAWRRVGMAIQTAGFLVEDKDRVKGIYYLRVTDSAGWKEKLKFWKADTNAEQRYRVKVTENSGSCQVSVTDQRGVSDAASDGVLETLQKSMGR